MIKRNLKDEQVIDGRYLGQKEECELDPEQRRSGHGGDREKLVQPQLRGQVGSRHTAQGLPMDSKRFGKTRRV